MLWFWLYLHVKLEKQHICFLTERQLLSAANVKMCVRALNRADAERERERERCQCLKCQIWWLCLFPVRNIEYTQQLCNKLYFIYKYNRKMMCEVTYTNLLWLNKLNWDSLSCFSYRKHTPPSRLHYTWTHWESHTLVYICRYTDMHLSVQLR